MARWETIEGSLKTLVPGRAMRTADAFWEDFRARASMRPQIREAEMRRPFAFQWAAAAAVVMLLIAGVSMPAFFGRREMPVNSIVTLDVATPHSAVFVMNDRASGGTILWIDCEKPAPTTGDVL